MQTKKVSQVTILSSLFWMFYSFIWGLLFILTLNAHTKVAMNNMETSESIYGFLRWSETFIIIIPS